MEIHLFAERRARYLDALGRDYALLVAPQVVYRNSDVEHRFRQESSLFWLTGWTWPECAALLRPGTDQPFILFVQPREPEREMWTGTRPGVEGAVERFGADAAYPYAELGSRLPELLQGSDTLHYTLGDLPEVDALVVGAMRAARRQANRNGLEAPVAVVDHVRLLHELRLVKPSDEVALLRRSVDIAVGAHRAAMAAVRPGMREYELEALIDGHFRRNGALGPSFGTIVASGANGATLHYTDNACVIQEGDLVLVDAGCDLDFFASDLSRTFPASGRFSPPQRELYEVVLGALKAGIQVAGPGRSLLAIHDTVVQVLTEGMVGLGLLQGSVADNIATGAYKRYYTHRTGHWLGMDVHDVGRYYVRGESRPLEPGMVFTVEPGLYVPAQDPQAPAAFRGMGIRIEDDVLVTPTGREVLSQDCPREVEDIEAWMAGSPT